MSRYHSSQIKRIKKGIFDLAFEEPPSAWQLCTNFCSNLQLMRRRSRNAGRLLKELFSIAPMAFLFYSMAVLWPSLKSALYLWSVAFLLETATDLTTLQRNTETSISSVQALVLMLVLCSFMTALCERISFQSSRRIKHGFRDRFYPQLARKSLALDYNTTTALEIQTILPPPWAYELDHSLGWEFLHGLTIGTTNFFTITLEISTLLAIVARHTKPLLSELVAFCCIVIPIMMMLIPTNGLGGVGYSFWTNHPAFHRLAAMHQVIFDVEYRKTLLKDGSTDFVLREYERSMKELGFLSFDEEMLCHGIPVAWYWQLLQVMVDVPLTFFLFTYPWIEQGSLTVWLTTGIFVQYAAIRLKQSINNVKTAQKPVHEVLDIADKFYRALESKGMDCQGVRTYPDRTHSLPTGMRISFRNVSLVPQSSFSVQPALQNVSFDVAPGQFVLLVGQNKSGTTSILHLLSGLFAPGAGSILIDGIPIQHFDTQSLRQAMTVLLHTEEIYPLSIRDNLTMSLSALDRAKCDAKPESFDRAVQMGGSSFIYKLPDKYETVLNPVPHFTTSSDVFGNGPVSSAVIEEMQHHGPRMDNIAISAEEKQRLIASRAFMKLNNQSGVRLLIVDEASSALDAIAERDLLEKFRDSGVGKTTIFLTHQFRHLVHKADLILCMHEGKLIQQGTHEQLVSDVDSEYARLYKAQV
ncbi:P-loop containing nucleoside triphosphate hydrolase protein [Rhodocollybia butyracea]|uniref:P-loop containing nucleoside triphosphate hydrolase protein n=1 Tax=Rhodocollybia butyracea TaxID=206335 RepID=A0A9P5PGS6_9AGAR|nr:P-loop containing nucleoside triphosphate hydrolase protein [Rhodocollybia butyracea]